MMRSASSISVDFTSFADCCDSFSRLLWPSQATKLLLPHIQCVTVSPPAPLLSPQVLPSLARLSQFCETANASISLALAAELVVLASSNCLETAHHKVFLFGPARALQLQSSDDIHGSPSPSIIRKRRLEESMAVISEVLFALNFAPLHFSAEVGINDVTQRERILDAILNINSAAEFYPHIPVEVHAETKTRFRQQLQQALSGTCTPLPLVLYHDDDDSFIESENENTNFMMELSSSAPLDVREALAVHFSAGDRISESLALNLRSTISSLLCRIVEQVSIRVGSSVLNVAVRTNNEDIQMDIKAVCSAFLNSIVLEATKRYIRFTKTSIPIISVADVNADSSHDSAAITDSDGNCDCDTQAQPVSVRAGPIYGRHPSYRAPVPEVEVISFEQVNPVWVHQCKPGSRICVLLRCNQRQSGVGDAN
jgi:hypothetical protein